MKARNRRKPPRPLDGGALRDLALLYVGRYATSRAKLAEYLKRKLRERGWQDERAPDVDGLVGRFADQGYVDDEAYALAKSRSLISRGYGPGRLRQQMLSAGIGDEDGAAARNLAEAEAAEAALRFARRRRIGPFADKAPDPAAQKKALAMLIRAGHSFALARRIVDWPVGEAPDAEALAASS